MTFTRQRNERIDKLPARFDILRSRAQLTGQLIIGYEGLSWLSIRARGVTDVQLVSILQQCNVKFPNADAQLQQLRQRLRAMSSGA